MPFQCEPVGKLTTIFTPCKPTKWALIYVFILVGNPATGILLYISTSRCLVKCLTTGPQNKHLIT
ncbi:MAG TPA: hypothetical protein VFX18_03255 [Candidatus Nitrosocosmicus sp.]|nr:hypothetical protein [Candidatus Nitrosocosmicus sp.]